MVFMYVWKANAVTSPVIAATQNGADSPHSSAMPGAVSPASTVPPMPMP